MPKSKTTPVDIMSVYSDVENVPDYKERWSRVQGKKTGLGFCQFVWQLLLANENPATGRKTDKTLLAIILQEFANSETTVKSFEEGNQSIAKLRHEFNNGKLQGANWPLEHPGQNAVLSLRYNAHGQPVNTQAPTNVATNGWLKDQLRKFQDTVLETPEELLTRLGRKKYNWNRYDSIE